LRVHAKLAESLGMPKDNIFVLEDGDILELGREGGKVVGRVPIGDIYVNGLFTGELDSAVLRDRKLLSRDGVVVVTLAVDSDKGKLVGKPHIETRGFIDADENRALIEKSQDVIVAALNDNERRLLERGFIEAKVRNSLMKFLYEQTHRRPVIISVAVGVGKPSMEKYA